MLRPTSRRHKILTSCRAVRRREQVLLSSACRRHALRRPCRLQQARRWRTPSFSWSPRLQFSVGGLTRPQSLVVGCHANNTTRRKARILVSYYRTFMGRLFPFGQSTVFQGPKKL